MEPKSSFLQYFRAKRMAVRNVFRNFGTMKDETTLTIGGEKLALFLDNKKIKSAVEAIAKRIHKDLEGEVPVFICVLKGAFVFASDLIRAYEGNCEIAFIRLASYEGTQSSGKIKTMMGLTDNIVGRSVVIVEDIIDSGLTMKQLLSQIEHFQPKQVKVASLFTKPSNLKCEVQIDYHCFEIPNKFIVGYGLDYDGLYRNLPDTYTK